MIQSFAKIEEEFKARLALNQDEINGFMAMRKHRDRRADIGAVKRKLTRQGTRAEMRLLRFLQANEIGFEFQKPVLLSGKRTAFVDFYIPEIKTIVELDGSVHDSDYAYGYDQTREALVLKTMRRAKFIRFPNQEVFTGKAGQEILKLIALGRDRLLQKEPSNKAICGPSASQEAARR